MRKEIAVLGMCFLLFVSAAGAQVLQGNAISFAAVKKITLFNTSGKKINLALPATPLRLFVLLSPECPLCKNYSLVLNRLHRDFDDDMEVYGIVPGSAYSGAELQQFAADYKIKFPLLIDKEKVLSGYLKATVTPEVFLINTTGQIVYNGAIDDWVKELGKKTLQPQQHYLEKAITQYLAGAPVQLAHTIAKGCLINEF
jgi:peroxiredoxin